MTFLDCVSLTSWPLVYAVISFEVRSLIIGVGIFSVNILTISVLPSVLLDHMDDPILGRVWKDH